MITAILDTFNIPYFGTIAPKVSPDAVQNSKKEIEIQFVKALLICKTLDK